jgi:hypothetical protein
MKARTPGICTKCGEPKTPDQFNKAKECLYGLRPECKSCEALRGSYTLKSIRFRLKHMPQWYASISCDLTVDQIEAIPNICYYCHKPLDKPNLHRLNHKGDYTITNVTKTHRVCHAKHGGHTQTKNPLKGFGTTKSLTKEVK